MPPLTGMTLLSWKLLRSERTNQVHLQLFKHQCCCCCCCCFAVIVFVQCTTYVLHHNVHMSLLMSLLIMTVTVKSVSVMYVCIFNIIVYTLLQSRTLQCSFGLKLLERALVLRACSHCVSFLHSPLLQAFSQLPSSQAS